MSDYVYMLESHLSPEQNRVVAEVMTAAGEVNANLFLTGGAMRDMLAGFRIRDLDFVVEGNALKLAKTVCDRADASIVAADENRKTADLLFPAGVTAQIAMSRQEKYGRPGTKAQVTPATIQEDLRRRDFTCNAIALSLNRASRGLLLDPMNGLADVERRELRAVSAYGFYDDPTRLLRMVRLRVRLGFTVEERTRMQIANAREAGVEAAISPRAVWAELRLVSAEDSPSEILRALDDEGLLSACVPALAGAKLNLAGLTKLDKINRLVPEDAWTRSARLGPFLYALLEKLTPKERQAIVKTLEIPKHDVDAWQKLEARSKKLETALRSPRIRKPSHVYRIVQTAPVDEVVFLLYHSALKPVQERLRSYYQKYLPAVQEIQPEEWPVFEGKPGSPKHQKARDEFIANRLDRRPPRKPVEPPPPPPPPVVEPVAVRRAR